MKEVIERAQEVLHGNQIKPIVHAVLATWTQLIFFFFVCFFSPHWHLLDSDAVFIDTQ